MCGIIGYVGDRDAFAIVVEGLRYLEYRGYDSVGVAICYSDKIDILKRAVSINEFNDNLKGKQLPGKIGIGHTRWATHGAPTDVNSHPFASRDGKFVVVHNGIIENYVELRDLLSKERFNFLSETDSEVVAYLFEYLYNGNVLQTLLRVANHLAGAFAIALITVYDSDAIYAIRKSSPLVLGFADCENYICSDINSIKHFATKVSIVDDMRVVRLDKRSAHVYDFDGVEHAIKANNVKCTDDRKSACGSHMQHEINDIPNALDYSLKCYTNSESIVFSNIEFFKKINKIYIAGCGTAYHAGCIGGYIIRKLVSGVCVTSGVAGELRYDSLYLDERTLIIAISQSGETADTLSFVRFARERGCKVLSFCNTPTATLVYESNFTVLTNAGDEIAVASTKVYNCQLLTLILFALDLSKIRGNLSDKSRQLILDAMSDLPEMTSSVLLKKHEIAKIAYDHYCIKSLICLGKGLDYYTALEAALKLKETSYIIAEAHAASELKHGSIALVENGIIVLALACEKELLPKFKNSLSEVKARGASIITISPFSEDREINCLSSRVVSIPDTHTILRPILAIIPAQILVYYIAKFKGIDVDRPRNLAKSVTTE